MLISLLILAALLIAVLYFAMTHKNVLNMVFLLCACFPYFKLFGIGTNTDIQLYTFIVAVFIVVVNMSKRKKRVVLSWQANSFMRYGILLATVIITVTIIRAFGSRYTLFSYLRGFMPYLAIVVLPLATYIAITRCGVTSIEKLLKFAYFAWIIVGIVQLAFPDFMIDVKDRLVFRGGRGSTSMAPEPAYYAVQLLLIHFILYLIDPKRYKWLICTTALTVSLIAKSATGTFYLLCFLLVFFATRKMVLPLLAAVFVSVCAILAFRNSLEHTRLYYLVTQIIVDPQRIIVADGSLNARVVEWMFSIKGSIENLFLPRGCLDWADYIYRQHILYPDWFFRRLVPRYSWNKLASMLGALLFEAGVFAIPLLRKFAKLSKLGTGNYKAFLFIVILSVNALNYTNPLFNVLIGYMIFRTNSDIIVYNDYETQNSEPVPTGLERAGTEL